MHTYFYKLIAPRPTFPHDMTEAERDAMGSHVAYWNQLVADETAVVFGAVLDPKGVFGAAIVELSDPDKALEIGQNDPVVAAGLGFGFEIHPMPGAVVRASCS